LTAEQVIALLDLAPHPEGGCFRETWRAASAPGERAAGTAIYYLLRSGEVSAWHRIDATELWHHYAGAPLELSVRADGSHTDVCRLGVYLEAGDRPQLVVPAHAWQSARTLGDWTLAGCSVSPAFEFSGFELAPVSTGSGGGASRPSGG